MVSVYQFRNSKKARKKQEENKKSLPTAENAFVEILQNGMDGPR